MKVVFAAPLFQEAEADGSEAAALRSENAELHSSVERLGAALHHAEVWRCITDPELQAYPA
jgi:hypothetical protein